jgi:hypothetical protein
VARQYHFHFASETNAKQFVHLVAQSRKNVALYRDGMDVLVIDPEERRAEILTLALRVDELK